MNKNINHILHDITCQKVIWQWQSNQAYNTKYQIEALDFHGTEKRPWKCDRGASKQLLIVWLVEIVFMAMTQQSSIIPSDPFTTGLRHTSRSGSTSNPGPLPANAAANIVLTRKAIEHSRRAFLKVRCRIKENSTIKRADGLQHLGPSLVTPFTSYTL